MNQTNSNINEALDYAIRLHVSGKLDRALFVYREIISNYPERVDLHLNIGSVLYDLGRYAESVKEYTTVLESYPESWQVLYNMGNSLMSLDLFQEAIQCYDKCFELNPDHVEALVTKGTALESIGKYDEGLSAYDEAISRKQNCAEAHWNRALALLRKGYFVEGWREYEWRWLKKGYTTKNREWSCEKWDGRPLNGDAILIHTEQAFGDTLQFVRYVTLVAAVGGKVVVECPAPLVSILSGVKGVWRAISYGTEYHAQYHVPLLSLPIIFGTTFESIPSNVPYLGAMPEKRAYWSNRIVQDGSLKIGLVWSGRKTPDPHRSCGLKVLQPLWEINGVTWYSLQMELDGERENHTEAELELTDMTKEIDDFADTAALIDNLDLVITIDTAVAHLSGGLGKLTYVMVPFAPDWRWMLGRSDSPWYPTMRIFRQKRPNDWDEVVRQLSLEVQRMVAMRK